MNKEEAKKRIEKLREVIHHHRYLYHVKNEQEISEEALDSLKHELYELEQEYPELITSDSPTQRVSGEPLDEFQKVEHSEAMLSIEDVFNREEIEDWIDYLKRLSDKENFEFFCELKMDGLAISLIYEKGILKRGATRGNGKIGEDVTQNIKTISTIPLKIKLFEDLTKDLRKEAERKIESGRIEVRGEAYMAKSDFQRINKKREKEGKEPYANPRNVAAGSIRQLNSKITKERDLEFMAYSLVTDLGQKSHKEEHKILKAIGFKADAYTRKCKNVDQIIDFWEEMKEKRDSLPYEIDGIVININDNQVFKKLGVAGKSPRGMRAFKFPPKQATTKVKDITVHVGQTGAVTPIAHLEPVSIAGARISRATLHNKDEMERLGIKINDTVIVERAGDVIPKVVKVLEDMREGEEEEFEFPTHCPICETKLQKPKDEAIWRCPNEDCPARKREFMYLFVSKPAFDIDGLGPKIIDQLMDNDLISYPPDIFEIKKGDLLNLERFAEKAAQNLIDAIEDSKEIPLHRFLFSLGIREVGEETAIDLANYFRNLENLQKASKEELEAINDIGPETAASIYEFFNKKKHKKMIKELKKKGVKIINPEIEKGEKLKGKSFVFTGGLDSMTRKEAQNEVRRRGGDPNSSVSSETDYLVTGENPGSKLDKAKELGVNIIKEEEFLKLIKE